LSDASATRGGSNRRSTPPRSSGGAARGSPRDRSIPAPSSALEAWRATLGRGADAFGPVARPAQAVLLRGLARPCGPGTGGAAPGHGGRGGAPGGRPRRGGAGRGRRRRGAAPAGPHEPVAEADPGGLVPGEPPSRVQEIQRVLLADDAGQRGRQREPVVEA